MNFEDYFLNQLTHFYIPKSKEESDTAESRLKFEIIQRAMCDLHDEFDRQRHNIQNNKLIDVNIRFDTYYNGCITPSSIKTKFSHLVMLDNEKAKEKARLIVLSTYGEENVLVDSIVVSQRR